MTHGDGNNSIVSIFFGTVDLQPTDDSFPREKHV